MITQFKFRQMIRYREDCTNQSYFPPNINEGCVLEPSIFNKVLEYNNKEGKAENPVQKAFNKNNAETNGNPTIAQLKIALENIRTNNETQTASNNEGAKTNTVNADGINTQRQINIDANNTPVQAPSIVSQVIGGGAAAIIGGIALYKAGGRVVSNHRLGKVVKNDIESEQASMAPITLLGNDKKRFDNFNNKNNNKNKKEIQDIVTEELQSNNTNKNIAWANIQRRLESKFVRGDLAMAKIYANNNFIIKRNNPSSTSPTP